MDLKYKVKLDEVVLISRRSLSDVFTLMSPCLVLATFYVEACYSAD